MHTDDRTTLSDLKSLIAAFVHEREWEKFHTPKNLSMSIAIEAAELMEHFQWLDQLRPAAVRKNPKMLRRVEDEVADIMAYCLSLANALQFDMSKAVTRKLKKNRSKYPVQRYKGRF